MKTTPLSLPCLLLLFITVLAVCPLNVANAQAPQDAAALAGTWVYQLGPNTLFALHLDQDPAKAGQLRGYMLRPENFSMDSPGGTIVHFSHIQNQSKREPLESTGWQEKLYRLAEVNPSAKPEDRDLLLVRLVDSRHIELKIAPPLPALQLERADGEPRLFDKWDSTRSYNPDDYLANNPEMQRIVDADQADRKDGMHIDWKRVIPADALRRTETAALLQKGDLHTSADFEHAAYVFQHGDTPDDYLLAHTLATVAISKGQSDAVWIAAATLDRYLQSAHQPQIFGTQFQTLQDKPTTQDPYNRTLISDALRGQMGVPSQAEQAAQRNKYDLDRGIKSQGTVTNPKP